MSSVISLSDLVNLSVGTPEAGCVNFSALRTLLHAILIRLNIQDASTAWTDEEPKIHGPANQQCYPGELRMHHQMESKIQNIEKQLSALERLPSAADLIACTNSRASPVNDMWQLMQLRRRVEANEDGVSKSMALIQDLMKEISDLQASRNQLQEEVRALQEQLSQLNVNELLDKIKVLDQCCHQVEDLEKVLSEVQETVKQYPDPEELTQFVTWDVLQDTLVSEPLRGPPSCDGDRLTPHLTRPRASPPSRISTGAESYPETVNALRHMGQLRKNHESLEERLAQLNNDKVDQSQLQHLREHFTNMVNQKVHDDLLKQLNDLKDLVDSVMADREKSSELTGVVQGAVLQLEAECKKFSDTISHLAEDRSQKQKDIDQLYKSLQHLEEKKADKDLVEMKIDIKADKRALETKVSRTQFDSVTEQLSSMFQELLGKVTGQEQNWHNVVEKISAEMESKLNRIELDSLKKQLEERWKAVRMQLQAQPVPELDDAAGFRKQLVARFHCISCDRPVDMLTPGPQLITIPCAPGLPCHKSSRPYTAYELEHVRQHCRSERIPETADYSCLPASRSCGGSHTLTLPNRRYTRLKHVTHFVQSSDEAQPSPGPALPAQEVDILGLDGHIYKGRLTSRAAKNMEPKLPTITHKEASSCSGWGRSMSSLGRLSQTIVSQSSAPVDTGTEVQQRMEIRMDHLQVHEGEVTSGKCS